MKRPLLCLTLMISLVSESSGGIGLDGPSATALLVSSQFSDVLEVSPGKASRYLTGLPGDPEDMALDEDGHMILAITGSGGKVLVFDPVTRNIIRTFSIGINNLHGLDIQDKNAFIASPSTGGILSLDLVSGRVSEVAGANLTFPYGLAFGADGALYVTETGTGEISRVNVSDGLVRTIASGFASPIDIDFDDVGNMYISQNMAGVITRVSSGQDGIFGTADDTRSDVVTDAESVFGLEAVGNELFFTRGGSDVNVSVLDLQSEEVSVVASLPEVGRFIAFSPVPEPSSLTMGSLISVAFATLYGRRVKSTNRSY